MKTNRVAAMIAIVAALCGCASRRAAPAAAAGIAGWHDVVTDHDRDRIRRWRRSFVAALAQANVDHASEIAAIGAPLQPDAALADPRPPQGEFACRYTKLGAQAKGGVDFVSDPHFSCRITVEGGILRFAKLDGVQRPIGTLYSDGADRMIFLGTMLLGDERNALRYGRDAQRDMVGLFQRIGASRWRLVLPDPAWESQLDVIDLVPAGG